MNGLHHRAKPDERSERSLEPRSVAEKPEARSLDARFTERADVFPPSNVDGETERVDGLERSELRGRTSRTARRDGEKPELFGEDEHQKIRLRHLRASKDERSGVDPLGSEARRTSHGASLSRPRARAHFSGAVPGARIQLAGVPDSNAEFVESSRGMP